MLILIKSIMRALIFIITLLYSISCSALEYTHPDGSHISIHIPGGLSESVEKTIHDEIRQILPIEIVADTVPVSLLPISASGTTDNEIDTTNWEHTIDARKIYSDNTITSVLITKYEYTGGAHGSLARIGLVMDTKTGKRLTLGDFYETKTLTSRLAPVWKKQIIRRLEQLTNMTLSKDEKNWVRDGVTDIQQYQSFIITPRMLIIYGQQYQHNAYAYGMQTLHFPRFKLTDIIRGYSSIK